MTKLDNQKEKRYVYWPCFNIVLCHLQSSSAWWVQALPAQNILELDLKILFFPPEIGYMISGNGIFLPVGPAKVTHLKFHKAKTCLRKSSPNKICPNWPKFWYWIIPIKSLLDMRWRPDTQRLLQAHMHQGFFQTNSGEWDIKTLSNILSCFWMKTHKTKPQEVDSSLISIWKFSSSSGTATPVCKLLGSNLIYNRVLPVG